MRRLIRLWIGHLLLSAKWTVMFPGAPVEECRWKEKHRQWNNGESRHCYRIQLPNFRSFCCSGQEPRKRRKGLKSQEIWRLYFKSQTVISRCFFFYLILNGWVLGLMPLTQFSCTNMQYCRATHTHRKKRTPQGQTLWGLEEEMP